MADNIDILVKLFETLQAASDKNSEATKQLIIQQLELVNQIKSLPVDDLRQALKEHAKDSAANIDACSQVVSVTSNDVMSLLRSVNGKLTKMLIALGLIVTIATGGYFVIRSTVDNEQIIEKHLDKKFNEMSERISKERAEDLEEIRQQMRNLHTDGSIP